MTYSMNKVQLIGYLGADPELRYTSGGKAVCNIRIATNSRWKDTSGEWQTHTDWHSVVVWERRGEQCKEYLRKGSYVYIEGRNATRTWEDRDGKKCYKTEVVARTIGFLDKKGEQGDSGYEPPPHTDNDQGGYDDDDDIPF